MKYFENVFSLLYLIISFDKKEDMQRHATDKLGKIEREY